MHLICNKVIHLKNKYCFNSMDDFSINNDILNYFKLHNIDYDEEEIFDDCEVLLYVIDKFDNEEMALDILKFMNDDTLDCIIERDDEEELRNLLLEKQLIVNYDDNIEDVIRNIGYDEFENLCHFTNKSILMMAIKKGWKLFCLELINNFPTLANVNKQNITNAREMAIKYNMNIF